METNLKKEKDLNLHSVKMKPTEREMGRYSSLANMKPKGLMMLKVKEMDFDWHLGKVMHLGLSLRLVKVKLTVKDLDSHLRKDSYLRLEKD